MGKKPFHNLLPVLAAYMFGSINIFGILADILFGWIWPVLLGGSSKLVGTSGEGQ